VYNCNKQFVAECFINSIVLLSVNPYFPHLPCLNPVEQLLDDSFGNSDHNSIKPEKRPDRNTIESQPVKPNTTQHESQMTRRQFDRESLHFPNFLGYAPRSLRQFHKQEPWVPLAFHQILCLPSLC
jgi:hypothetical protein